MGTNYYVIESESIKCKTCGHVSGGDQMHIGKSSCGWVFMMNAYPDKGITDFTSWVIFLSKSKSVIKDEYGHNVSLAGMIDIIVNRSHPSGDLHRNEEGDHGWFHGEGTWDVSSQTVDFS